MTAIDGSTWYSVDLPAVMDLRRRLLPHDGALSLAGTVPGVRVARDIPLPPGRGWWRLLEFG